MKVEWMCNGSEIIADKEQSKCPEKNLAFCLFAHKKKFQMAAQDVKLDGSRQ